MGHQKGFLSTYILVCSLFATVPVTPVYAIEFKPYPIITEKRLTLTKQYSLKHYGADSYKLHNPKIVVVHYTVIPTLQGCLKLFKADVLASNRKAIKNYGRVNVGVHYLIDRNGDIYTLLPTDVMGRHVIGFNYTSIGIENVAANAKHLTPKQLEANVRLIKWLSGKFSSIEFLIGHHEYMQKYRAHFKLYKELDKSYKPTIKSDPGKRFMLRLRAILKDKGVNLKD